MKSYVGRADIVMITLDTLRYDVAQQAWEDGDLPGLSPYLGPVGWEKRHSPASFTYAAHHAFLSGFLPTPASPGLHPRLFGADFAGSATLVQRPQSSSLTHQGGCPEAPEHLAGLTPPRLCILDTLPRTGRAHRSTPKPRVGTNFTDAAPGEEAFVFEEATLPQALSIRGYSTICVGGTGFFNQKNALSKVLPGLFQEAYWSPDLGVSRQGSERHQVDQAIQALEGKERAFLFMNVSALHQPNWFYGSQASGPDNLESHRAALIAVDRALMKLWSALARRGPAFVMIFSDHGTAYGEDGYTGHRLAHEVVWTVPYGEFCL